MRWLLPAIFLSAPLIAAPAKSHLDFRREAEAAYQRKDYPAARAATADALKLRPDSPRYLYNLAALCALLGQPAEAIDYLRRLTALGVVMPVQRNRDFASLQGTPEFFKILQAFSANGEPRGAAEVWAELPGRTGIIEGIAFRDRTGDVFLSDVHHRCIWRRDRNGHITRFTDDDEDYVGIFGLAIDEPRNTLWAAMTALPEMAGFEADMKGYAALAEIDLTKGELRRVIAVPADGRDHGLGDVLLAGDGTVYVTDSMAPVIWQLAPGAEELQKVVDSPIFTSLQGMALLEKRLLVSDYSNGLFTVDIPTGDINALTPPPNTTLLGIDGIVRVGDTLIAVQNGIEPQRMLQIKLSPTWTGIVEVTVLAAAIPNLTDLGLATIANGLPTVIAGTGWDGFDPKNARQPPAHAVRLFQVALPQ
jgi:sugar lactone lactonase YvrE